MNTPKRATGPSVVPHTLGFLIGTPLMIAVAILAILRLICESILWFCHHLYQGTRFAAHTAKQALDSVMYH